MKTIILSALFMAVFMGSGANAQQQGVKGDAFYAKFDADAQALIKQNGAEKMIMSYLDAGTFAKYWRISQDTLAEWIYEITLLADENGYPSLVTGPENASDLFRSSNYGTETVAALKQSGITSVKMGRMLYGKVNFYEQPLSGLDNSIEFGVLYDANNVPFPVIKKGINSVTQCCLNLCFPKQGQQSEPYVDQGGDGGQSYQKVERSAGGDVYFKNINIIANSGNSSSDQTQDQSQTVSAPAPQQQGSGFVQAEISYNPQPTQMTQPINYNPGYSAPPVNYGNSGTVVCNNRPNGLQVADFIVDVATLGVAGYGAYKSWQIYNKPAPTIYTTGGNTTYGNNSYNSGAYGNGLLPPYVGPGGGTGTGGGLIDIGNGGPGNH